MRVLITGICAVSPITSGRSNAWIIVMMRNMATDRMPGRSNGSVMRAITLRREAPSTTPASSSNGSMLRRSPLSMTKAVGVRPRPLITMRGSIA